MAPEQQERGGARVDARADIYALAVMAHEMLTGSRPGRGTAVGSSLRPLFDRALDQRPEARHRSVADFFQDLKSRLTGDDRASEDTAS